jgi:putative ABC transport system substrate-binding protein
VLSDPSTGLHREQIVTMAARHGLPGIYPFRFFVTIGGLASYGVHRRDQFRHAGVCVARVFKGEGPADLTVQTPINSSWSSTRRPPLVKLFGDGNECGRNA